VGKTKLSIELAKELNGEIINADSTQIYKLMNIGTAKITEKEKEGIPHHLFDIKNLDEEYTVFDYQKDCRYWIDNILRRGKTPIIVGGTGLYIKAALYDYNFKAEEIEYAYSQYSTDDLYKQLIEVDPSTNIHPNNRKRIERALTYYKNHNEPISESAKSETILYDTVFIGLTTDRETLYDKINKRTDKMVEDGLIEEAYMLYSTQIKSRALLTPICYKELFGYFDGDEKINDVIDLIKQRCRKYAKRQYTWFRNQLNVEWVEVNFNDFNKTIEEVKKRIAM
jgi:tRNA dimethylallyltransferase